MGAVADPGGEGRHEEMTGPPTSWNSTLRMGDNGRGAVLAVDGELDLSNCDELESAIDEAVAAATGPVTLDLGGVVFLDSSAIHALLRVRRRHGEAVRLGSASAAVDHVLELAGVRDLLS